jgi:hypothetical protein
MLPATARGGIEGSDAISQEDLSAYFGEYARPFRLKVPTNFDTAELTLEVVKVEL